MIKVIFKAAIGTALAKEGCMFTNRRGSLLVITKLLQTVNVVMQVYVYTTKKRKTFYKIINY